MSLLDNFVNGSSLYESICSQINFTIVGSTWCTKEGVLKQIEDNQHRDTFVVYHMQQTNDRVRVYRTPFYKKGKVAD